MGRSMTGFRYHCKLSMNGLTGGALLIALLLLLAACSLKPLGFVEGEVQVRHVVLLYGMGFPLVAVFLFSSLFAEETEEDILAWLFVLPFSRTVWLAQRWVLGMVAAAVLYYGPLFIIDRTVVLLPWKYFAWELWIPALWLGHVGLFLSLLFRQSSAGLAGGLGYWAMEALSKGVLTGEGYLFRAASFNSETGGHTQLLLFGLLSGGLLAGCMRLVKPGHFRR
jgi:hypothetical protein